MEHQIDIQFRTGSLSVHGTCCCGWRGEDHLPQTEPIAAIKHEYKEHLFVARCTP